MIIGKRIFAIGSNPLGFNWWPRTPPRIIGGFYHHAPIRVFWLRWTFHSWISPSWTVDNCQVCREQFLRNEGRLG